MTRPTTKTLAHHIASALQAHRYTYDNSLDFAPVWEALLDVIERKALPSGSGFDSGTTIDRSVVFSKEFRLVTSFHHMSEHGYYDGWTDHVVAVKPDWNGVEIDVSGPDRHDVNDYIGEMFACVLGEFWDLQFDHKTRAFTFVRTPTDTTLKGSRS